MSWRRVLLQVALLILCVLVGPVMASAQPLGEPDRGAPGDQMIQAYLAKEAARLSANFAADLSSQDSWDTNRARYVDEYFYMLGLSPRPEKTPLHATVTGTVTLSDYVVELLHYQSRPGLYVTANLYRPAVIKTGDKLPAVFYVCGHSGRGRNGNKVAYQSHGIWFARHGYVCLVVDSLQLGEIAAYHHGTYNLQRWWWHSRGYTPAGVEAWNGVRGIDYLASRSDVDPERIAVTGISGGGAATFWIAAADDRVKVAVPVSGMADLDSYVANRVINGHCDCMFLHNTFRWPWVRIAGLVAPRPMLFVNSDQDRIFPMDANERVIQALERLYSQLGAGDRVDAVVSVGGHAYREDIRQAAYRFINAHLKGDARPITDSEVDIVSEGGNPGPYPIPPESLRVFAADGDLPADQLNTVIDERFVPLAAVELPEPGQFQTWRKSLLNKLHESSFRYFPKTIPSARVVKQVDSKTLRLASEEGIEFVLRHAKPILDKNSKDVLLVILNEDETEAVPEWISKVVKEVEWVVFCEPRGVGATKWTRKNPPNYVERSHVLLGRTVDSGRVWDVIAAANYLKGRDLDAGIINDVQVAGKGRAGVIAAYAAIIDNGISAVTLVSPPQSHMDSEAPQFLNVLRTCDIPDALGMLAPRPLTIHHSDPAVWQKTTDIYGVADAAKTLTIK